MSSNTREKQAELLYTIWYLVANFWIKCDLSKPLTNLLGITKDNLSEWLYWPIRLLIIFPAYQVLLVIIGAIFGQFNFFWEFEKKMLDRLKLGFIGKYIDNQLNKKTN